MATSTGTSTGMSMRHEHGACYAERPTDGTEPHEQHFPASQNYAKRCEVEGEGEERERRGRAMPKHAKRSGNLLMDICDDL
jgi:hypothetical protein